MRIITLLLLFIICAQFSLGTQKVITTQVNFTMNSTGFLLDAEENTHQYYYVNSSSNYTTNITLLFYRDIANSSIENLSLSYSVLSDNYDSLRKNYDSIKESCKTLNDSYNNLVDFYSNINSKITNRSEDLNIDYAKCFFSLDYTNRTLIQCQTDLTTKTNELTICNTDKNNYKNSYDSCYAKLGNYLGTGVCATDLQNAQGNEFAWVWSALIASGIVWLICYLVYRKGTKYQPHSEVTGDTEHFEGLG